MRRKRGRQCEQVLEDGRQCSAHALTEERRLELDLAEDDPWLCRIHQLAASGELSAVQQRAARANGSKRRGDSEAAARATIDPGLTFRDVAAVVREALTSTLETGLPDRSARLAACAVLLLAFPKYTRPTVAEAQRLLREVLPPEIDSDRLEVDEAFRALRSEWWSLPAWHPIRGLVARELPRDLVPPWLDYATVVRQERPKDIPPAEAPVTRFANGRVALQRPGEFPLMLDSAEDDGGLIRV